MPKPSPARAAASLRNHKIMRLKGMIVSAEELLSPLLAANVINSIKAELESMGASVTVHRQTKLPLASTPRRKRRV